MRTGTRERLRLALKVMVLVLSVAAIAITFIPSLSEFRTYRMTFMIMALSGALFYQGLEPKTTRSSAP